MSLLFRSLQSKWGPASSTNTPGPLPRLYHVPAFPSTHEGALTVLGHAMARLKMLALLDYLLHFFWENDLKMEGKACVLM